jgi:hypothetical protein
VPATGERKRELNREAARRRRERGKAAECAEDACQRPDVEVRSTGAWVVVKRIPGVTAKMGDRLPDAEVRGWLGWRRFVEGGFLRPVTLAELAATPHNDRVEAVSLRGVAQPFPIRQLVELLFNTIASAPGGRMALDDLTAIAAADTALGAVLLVVERLVEVGYVDRDADGHLRATRRGLDVAGGGRPDEPLSPCSRCGLTDHPIELAPAARGAAHYSERCPALPIGPGVY